MTKVNTKSETLFVTVCMNLPAVDNDGTGTTPVALVDLPVEKENTTDTGSCVNVKKCKVLD